MSAQQPGTFDRAAFIAAVREAIDKAARGWLDGTVPTDKIDAKDWSTHEWIRFLQAMPEKLTAERLADLDKRFGLTNRGRQLVRRTEPAMGKLPARRVVRDALCKRNAGRVGVQVVGEPVGRDRRRRKGR